LGKVTRRNNKRARSDNRKSRVVTKNSCDSITRNLFDKLQENFLKAMNTGMPIPQTNTKVRFFFVTGLKKIKYGWNTYKNLAFQLIDSLGGNFPKIRK
jgi:hypothetical protein